MTTLTYWGMSDRGLLCEGAIANIVVFDPDCIAPIMPELVYDLPAGARRLQQKATGIAAEHPQESLTRIIHKIAVSSCKSLF